MCPTLSCIIHMSIYKKGFSCGKGENCMLIFIPKNIASI